MNTNCIGYYDSGFGTRIVLFNHRLLSFAIERWDDPNPKSRPPVRRQRHILPRTHARIRRLGWPIRVVQHDRPVDLTCKRGHGDWLRVSLPSIVRDSLPVNCRCVDHDCRGVNSQIPGSGREEEVVVKMRIDLVFGE